MQSHTKTAEETEAVGSRLASRLAQMMVGAERDRRRSTVVYLVGELGAGKTTLARGFVRGSGICEAVRSPSYNLMDIHEMQDGCIVHLDLYRIREPSELEALGLRDWERQGVIWLVEWPERGTGHLPPSDLTVTLGIDRGGHSINAVACSAFAESWLQSLS